MCLPTFGFGGFGSLVILGFCVSASYCSEVLGVTLWLWVVELVFMFVVFRVLWFKVVMLLQLGIRFRGLLKCGVVGFLGVYVVCGFVCFG